MDQTFHFVPTAPDGSHRYRRAEYTLETLKLNQGGLPEFRDEAYRDYLDLLKKYVSKPSKNNRERLAKRSSYKCVWLEMKRQHLSIPELRDLFDQAPKALRF